ncbi:MAG: bifunctional 4-hydroxy-2-oxoglutarate aldolase/2-dehydro-3-deoxy-phosphogluconate aldolase [Planctomycetaceae bacterium]|jgi:2-dehydro-3-deoxyphosphogluconate aldolase/(4S)-4-hydroxy-2-oxoglutarate aldolase|nr:bifunctional 4-hydroxy-2-oxoglutarate aldolase/2-dehydro-3-deoxy-phosphogluconate aldolase [Planctomycetaceae bacterium]
MLESSFSESILKRFFRCGVIACMTIGNPLHAVPAARALLAGGIDVIELTLRTPKSMESLRRITAEVPEILAGVGTILTPQQVEESIVAGGHFGVAPGLSERVVKTAQDKGLPFAPGIATPSELEQGLELGCREMKFFPAEPSGGVSFMKSIYAPYAHLGVQFLPLGGINIRNMGDYLRETATLAVGGSWIVTSDLLQTENWAAITDAARTASTLVKEIRQDNVQPAGSNNFFPQRRMS